MNSIKSWAEMDRPREKMANLGRQSLSDSELLAILLGSGGVGFSAVDLAKEVLAKAQNNLDLLGKFSLKELQQFKGIGEAKAITIAAALELGRRRKSSRKLEKPKITSSKDAFEVIHPSFIDLPHEEFWIILLSTNNTVKRTIQVSKGGISATVADPKIILRHAIEHFASGLILAHNHPSGNLNPSNADRALTQKIKEACVYIDTKLLDHIIVTDSSYYSFADSGML